MSGLSLWNVVHIWNWWQLGRWTLRYNPLLWDRFPGASKLMLQPYHYSKQEKWSCYMCGTHFSTLPWCALWNNNAKKEKPKQIARFRRQRKPTTVNPSLSIFTSKAFVEIPYRVISPCCTIQTGRSDLKYLLYKRRSKCRCCCLVSNLYFRDGLLFFFICFFFCARVHLKACRGWLNLFNLPKDHSMFFQFSVCANFCWWKKPATATRTMMTCKIRELYVIF